MSKEADFEKLHHTLNEIPFSLLTFYSGLVVVQKRPISSENQSYIIPSAINKRVALILIVRIFPTIELFYCSTPGSWLVRILRPGKNPHEPNLQQLSH